MKRVGFTLIELLVVVSIIALLVALISPSLRMAQRLAVEGVCKSNTHTFAQAMTAYSSENRAFFVSCMEWVRECDIEYGQPGWFWGAYPFSNDDKVLKNGKLWKFIGRKSVYICPTFSKLKYPYDESREIQFSYSMNGHISHLWYRNENQRVGGWYQMVTDLHDPSKVFMLSEEMPYRTAGHSVAGLNDGVLRGESYILGQERGDALAYLHGDGTEWDGYSNTVFADGHVGTAHIWETYKVTFDPRVP